MLEIWTNGRYKSTLHRVLTSFDCERYSILFFFDPTFETVVECLENRILTKPIHPDARPPGRADTSCPSTRARTQILLLRKTVSEANND